MNLRLVLAIFLVITMVLGFNTIQPTTVEAAAASVHRGVCVYYYGGWSDSIQARFISTLPEFIVLNSRAGPYGPSRPNSTDIAALKSAGIKVLCYVPTGGMRGYKWDSDSPANDRASVRKYIAAIAAEGDSGIFFDEGGLYSPVSGQTYQDSILDRYLVSPGGISGNSKYVKSWGDSWAGYTVEDYLSYAHSFGLITSVCLDDYRSSKLNPNIFAITDFVLSAEEYATRPVGMAPAGSEIGHTNQCWVLSYNGAYNTSATNKALGYGFRAAYCCQSMGSLPQPAYENYMTAVTVTSPSSPATTYTVNVSTSGSGTTNPAPGTYGSYAGGTAVSITATPSSGYKFDYWAGGISGTANPVTFTVNSNLSVQAVFTSNSSSTASSLYESYTSANDQSNLGGTLWQGQTFTPATTHTITKVRLPLLKQGSPSGNVVVSIRRTDASGLPTGSDLAAGSVACSTLTSSWSPATWYDFNLGAGCQLTAGTKYALIISAPGAASSGVYYWVNTAGTYSRGTTVYSSNSGASWGSYSGWDTVFEDWGSQGLSPMIPLAVTTTSLPNGTAGVSYSQTLAASGGATPYTWSLSSGNLPANLSLNASTGVISGTPTAAATSTFTVKVTGSTGTTSTAAIAITINAASTTPVRFEYYGTSSHQDNLGGTAWKGQTFIPATTHTVTKVRLPLLNPNSQSGNVTVSIRRTDSSGLPTGSDLASGSIACSALTTHWTPVTWYDFNLGAGCQLTAGTKYALIIQAPSAASGIYYWANTAGTYSKGTVICTFNGGSSWSSYSGWDMAFEEWGK